MKSKIGRNIGPAYSANISIFCQKNSPEIGPNISPGGRVSVRCTFPRRRMTRLARLLARPSSAINSILRSSPLHGECARARRHHSYPRHGHDDREKTPGGRPRNDRSRFICDRPTGRLLLLLLLVGRSVSWFDGCWGGEKTAAFTIGRRMFASASASD